MSGIFKIVGTVGCKSIQCSTNQSLNFKMKYYTFVSYMFGDIANIGTCTCICRSNWSLLNLHIYGVWDRILNDDVIYGYQRSINVNFENTV